MSNARPAGRTVVFIHGNFVSNHCWEHWIDRYEAKGCRCLAIAYPGRDRPVRELRARVDDPVLGALTLAETIEHHVREIRAQPEKPIIIGHSFGGLLTQLMVQRDLASAAVAIGSVPPQGVLAENWSFYRATWPVINPLIPASHPYLMPFEHFQYTFVNGLTPGEQRAVYDEYVVPESRRLVRGGLSKAARVDFRRAHAPLLMIGGERDNIMPAALNQKNARRYRHSGSITDFKLFPGRTHYTEIGGSGWEEVADYALDWALKMSIEAASTAPQEPAKSRS